MILFRNAHARPIHGCLREVIGKRRGTLTNPRTTCRARLGNEASVACGKRATTTQRIRSVRRYSLDDSLLSKAITLCRVNRRVGAIDWQLIEVRATGSGELGIEIGEVPCLPQRIVGEADAARHVIGAKRDLLRLSEVVRRTPVER